MKVLLIGLTLLTSMSSFAGPYCRYEVGSNVTVFKNSMILTRGQSYTRKAKKPKGDCDYLDSTSSPKSCQSLASNKGYDCYQVTNGKYTANTFWRDGKISTYKFKACWGCF